jgi:hypothetical protein
MTLYLYAYHSHPEVLTNYDKKQHVDHLLFRDARKIKEKFGDDPEVLGFLKDRYEKLLGSIVIKTEADIFTDEKMVSMSMPGNILSDIGELLGKSWDETRNDLLDELKQMDIDSKLSSQLMNSECYRLSIPHYVMDLIADSGTKLTKTKMAIQQKYNDLNGEAETRKINSGKKKMDQHISDLTHVMNWISQLSKIS